MYLDNPVLKGGNMNRINRYVAGLYCRLSKDDGNTSESMSIKSQKSLLKQFADDNKIMVYDYYVDDGYSGTNFNRPSFQKLKQDIECGNINCVITKDLSRLGRNYLESGAYIEVYFPENNVRYIAINDGIDTLKTGYNSAQLDIMPFKNILNEMYAKDTSNKIKSVLKVKMKEGNFIGNKAPFGYKKNPKNKHELIIDEETRYIVELIYELCLEGMGTQLICAEMERRKIPRPSAFCENGEKLYGVTEENKYTWTHRMALEILRDCVYCGDLARNKRPTLSFKNSKRLYVPKEDYIVVRNTHEPIISREDWELAQEMIDSRRCENKHNRYYDNIFKGLVKCPDCNYSISANVDYRYKKKDIIDCVHYTCSTYRRKGTDACSSHRIDARDLYEIVLADIQYHGEMAIRDKKDLLTKIKGRIARGQIDEDIEIRNKLDENKKELEHIDNLFMQLYEDRLAQKISERNFQVMNEKFSQSQIRLEDEIKDLENKLEEGEDKAKDFDKFIENISQYAKIRKLNRYILNQLIDTIYVYEKEYENDKVTQKIEIYYKFIGNIS